MKKSIVLTLTTIFTIALLSSVVLATNALSGETTPANPETNNTTDAGTIHNITNTNDIFSTDSNNNVLTNTLNNTNNTITPNSNTVTDHTTTYIPGGELLNNNVTPDLYTPEQGTPNTENAENDLTQTPTNTPSVNTSSSSSEMGIDTIVNILMTVVGIVIILLGFAILVKSK